MVRFDIKPGDFLKEPNESGRIRTQDIQRLSHEEVKRLSARVLSDLDEYSVDELLDNILARQAVEDV